GPQFRRSGTIRLRVRPNGFGTVADPDLYVDGADLVAPTGRFPLSGATLDSLATSAGVQPGKPEGLYHDGSGADRSETVAVDPIAAAEITAAFVRGDDALRRLVPGETPVLWPEHFDLGIGADEVNYGISPGDEWLGEPYAYVGPWRPRTGAFWTAPFGAARPMRELSDADAVLAFLTEGRDRAAGADRP
ncbi:MAG TPA: hypothetical protein VGF84_06190, partial [Micromonosporaceae bacterium]